jgi:3'(2'), 5'-bisphosphate nucleotidase
MIPLPPIDLPMSELAIALEAAEKAGTEVMKIYDTNFSSNTKKDDSPITEADLKSNEIIKKILTKTTHHLLSEEDKDNKSRLEKKTVWIVDPLDGTSDFVDKTGEFTIMIGLVIDGHPVLGVINWPDGNTIYAAQIGKGAFRYYKGNWEKIKVSQTSDLKKCSAVGSRHHLSEQDKMLIEKLGFSSFTSLGSSLKVGKISCGEADAYITSTDKIKEWDTCASYCIVTEAGGKMTDMNGNDITYNNEQLNHKNGILVTNGKIHKKILEQVN